MTPEQPRPEFVKVFSKLPTLPSEEELQALCVGLEPDEIKIIQAMRLTAAADDEKRITLLNECLQSTTPGIAFMAELFLKHRTADPPPEPKIFRPDGDLDRVIGWMRWTVKEAPSFDVIDTGELFVKLTDFAIRLLETDGTQIVSKMIRVNDQFSFHLAGKFVKSPEDMRGFGFSGCTSNAHSFSWEWFNVDAPNHAVKLQEEGEVSFQMIETSEGLDIVSTRFLKDLSFRIIRFGIDEPMNPHWRLEIAANSEITWPSLLGGKIVVNERQQ